jgi:hypothetical protein
VYSPYTGDVGYSTLAYYSLYDSCKNQLSNLDMHETFGSETQKIANNYGSAHATSFNWYQSQIADQIATHGVGANPKVYSPQSQDVAIWTCSNSSAIHTTDEVDILQQTFYGGSNAAGTTTGLLIPVLNSQNALIATHNLGYYLEHGCAEDINPNSRPTSYFRAVPASVLANRSGLGQAQLFWDAATGVAGVQVYVGPPSPPSTSNLFSQTGPDGSGTTGQWVTNGMTFYLQNITNGAPGATLMTYSVGVTPP